MAPDEEVPHVVAEAVREILEHAAGVRIVRRLLEARAIPRVRRGPVEREDARAEFLSIAALIVPLSRIQGRPAEKGGGNEHEDDSSQETASPLSAPPEPQHD